MLFRIYALENTPAKLCKFTTTTNDPIVCQMVKTYWEAEGYIVNITEEA